MKGIFSKAAGSRRQVLYCRNAVDAFTKKRIALPGAQAHPRGDHRRQEGPHRRGPRRDRPVAEGPRAHQDPRGNRRSRRARALDEEHLRAVGCASRANDREGAGRIPRELRQTSREASCRPPPAACRRLYSYFTSTISNSFTPPGVRTSTTSPEYFPMSALAIGDE